jgi:hypothetical protein
MPRAEESIDMAHDEFADRSVQPDRPRDALDRINAALRGLRYGTVTAVVQDGVVVQVERTEKFRLEKLAR